MGINIQDIAYVKFSAPDLEAMAACSTAAWRSAKGRKIYHEQS